MDLSATPAGNQNFRGIPFLLGDEGTEKKSWVVLSSRVSSWATSNIEVALGKRAGFLCLGMFCDWDKNETPPPGKDVIEKVGQRLAEAVLVYEEGDQLIFPIRRRFEVNSPSVHWGHWCFGAEPHFQDAPRGLTAPLRQGTEWGWLQTGIRRHPVYERSLPIVWVCALSNPHPKRMLKALRLQAAGEDPLAVCGLTLFHGSGHPLRYERLSLYRLTCRKA